MAPLWVTTPMPRPRACAGNDSGSKVSATRSVRLTRPMQFGPHSASFAVAGDPRHRVLLGAPGLVHLGKARGEHQRGADLAAHAGLHRIDRRLARHRQHGDVDAVG